MLFSKPAVLTILILMSVHVVTHMPLSEVIQWIFVGILSAALAQPMLNKK